MKRRAGIIVAAGVCLAFGALLWLGAGAASGHCDTLDGPVVAEARSALEAGDVTPVLKWVAPGDEAEIRAAFEKTLKVRALGPQARELADMYFFETLVRVHRASEGAPYTGLKPAGEVEPPIEAADAALESGSVDKLARRVAEHASAGIRERFNRAMEAKKHAGESVETGREYVKAYVEYVHYVEGLHNAIERGGHAH